MSADANVIQLSLHASISPGKYLDKLRKDSANYRDLYRFSEFHRGNEYSRLEAVEARDLVLQRFTKWFLSRDDLYRLALLELIEVLSLIELVPQLVGFLRYEYPPEVQDRISQVIVSLTRMLAWAGGNEGIMRGIIYSGVTEGDAELEREHKLALEALRANRRAYQSQSKEWYAENEGRFASFAEGRLRHVAGGMDEAVFWERENIGPSGPDVFTIKVRKPDA